MQPSRRQRNELSRTLKRFAFEQSPLFGENKIQAMEVAQSFEIIEKVPEGCFTPGTLQFDQLKIKLGFTATRFSESAKAKPVYSYLASVEGTQLIHPRQLNLSDDSWVALWKKYLEDEDQIDPEELAAGTVLHAETVPADMRDEIIDVLIDAGAECELYQKSMLSFSSCEPGIESSYERGISIENALFDSVSTHDHFDDDYDSFNTPDGVLYIRPPYAPDELPIGDEIEVRTQFIDVVRGLGMDKETSENDFLPHEYKLREMMHVVECLRKRRIDLD